MKESQIVKNEDTLETLQPKTSEWPAFVPEKVSFNGEEISFQEYLLKVNNNNRGGT